jgi:glycosyltransferase involved in cell wall biosynthesis
MSTLKDRPACTILLPVYNGEKYIEKSIRNLKSLAGPQDEILIVDDGSVDKTFSLLQQHAKFDPRLTIMSLKHVGIVGALNFGLRTAKHDYIARADVDDNYKFCRLELQISKLELDESVGAIFSDYTFVSSDGRNLGYMPSAVNWKATALSLSSGIRTAHPSVIFRRNHVLSVGGYLESDFPAEDLGLWVRLAGQFKIISVPQDLLSYTINHTGISKTRSNEMKLKRDRIRKTINYKLLLEENLSAYNFFKIEYKNYSHKYERLSLHNLELLLAISRLNFEISTFLRAKMALRILFRFWNPPLLFAILRLHRDRSKRIRNVKD